MFPVKHDKKLSHNSASDCQHLHHSYHLLALLSIAIIMIKTRRIRNPYAKNANFLQGKETS
jgi:hypothetical protein